MKKYDLLISAGCSFTEGGGLNSPEYHKYLTGYTSENTKTTVAAHNEYSNYHSFPGYLSRLLGCKFINLGQSSGSNELIFKNLYTEINNNHEGKILVTLQTSIISRILLYIVDNDNFININGVDGLPANVALYYKNYIKRFFKRDIEYKKLLQNIDVYTSWLLNKNIDVVWIPADLEGNIVENKFTINFGNNESLLDFATTQKLRIIDLPNIHFKDHHLNESGNELVAKKIYEHVERHYND